MCRLHVQMGVQMMLTYLQCVTIIVSVFGVVLHERHTIRSYQRVVTQVTGDMLCETVHMLLSVVSCLFWCVVYV